MGDTVKGKAQDQPEIITAAVSEEEARELALQRYGVEVVSIKQLNGYDDRNFHITVTEKHTNPHIGTVCPLGYVLKIVNTLDSKWPSAFDMQVHAMRHLNQHGITAPVVVKNLSGEFHSEERFDALDEEGNRTAGTEIPVYLLRMCTYIPGTIFYEHPCPTLKIFRQIGELVARVGTALKGVKDHPIFAESTAYHGTIWHMKNHAEFKDYIFAIRDPQRRAMATEITERFESDVLPKSHSLPQGVIHDDINEQNVLVEPNNANESEAYRICGILDFGDINLSCQVFDLAVSIMYYCTMEKEGVPFLDIGRAVIAGYQEVRTLTRGEKQVLPLAVMMRFALSVGMGEYNFKLDPNNTYLLTTAAHGWRQLETLWNMDEDELRRVWDIALE